MAGRKIEAARWTKTPLVNYWTVGTNGSTIVDGCIVKLDSDGGITRAGADPTASSAKVIGVVHAPTQSAPGYGMPSGVTQVTGRVNAIPVLVFEPAVVYSMRGSSNPTLANQGVDYGVTEDADGTVYLDLTETTATLFRVIDIDTDNNVFYCTVISGKTNFGN